ncbi:hypothetical protein Zmor_026183 [Zophobas morio]|uniref:Uncharacterized protein n=1 Tax=Zophobas morio TaxID=2755281 RepID=A0AA38HT46_9CUCU|nr:hypothetical protein Zmor_026183 [Zophobas morio]
MHDFVTVCSRTKREYETRNESQHSPKKAISVPGRASPPVPAGNPSAALSGRRRAGPLPGCGNVDLTGAANSSQHREPAMLSAYSWKKAPAELYGRWLL